MANIIEINNLDISELDIYARLTESELYHIYEPKLGLFIAESPKVIERALNAGYEPVSFLLEKRHVNGEAHDILERCPEVLAFVSDYDTLVSLTGFALTRGVLCAMKRKTLPAINDICKNARRIAIVEDVVNPTNVGAIVRNAAAFNIDCILFTSASSDPLYRRAIRVSMGTIFQIPWTVIPCIDIDLLHSLGFKTVAMALRNDSYNIDAPVFKAEEKLAIILGTEGEGLKNDTIVSSDYTCMIPMYHNVDSLNVAAASAVAFYELSK